MSNIRAVFKTETLAKSKFKDSSCILTVSVGQEVHEGEKLLKTIQLVNKSFKTCILLVDDTLQRHTMALNRNQSADFFYATALKEGDNWLERNKKYFHQLQILKHIYRWDDWLLHKNYFSRTQEIRNLINTDAEYKNAFEFTVSEFLNRYSKRLQNINEFDFTKAKQLCHDYLVEECAVLCLLKELNYQFEVYPGKRNLAMEMTHKKLITFNNENILDAVRIKFINKKQLQPQQFELLNSD